MKEKNEQQIKKNWTINLDIILVHNNKFEALLNKNFSTICDTNRGLLLDQPLIVCFDQKGVLI